MFTDSEEVFEMEHVECFCHFFALSAVDALFWVGYLEDSFVDFEDFGWAGVLDGVFLGGGEFDGLI